MFISRADYEIEKLKLIQRIDYLENLICPYEKHDYIQTDYHFKDTDRSGSLTTIIYHYTCTKCGKKIQTDKVFD